MDYCCVFIIRGGCLLLTKSWSTLECIGLGLIYYKIKSCCTGKKKDLPTKNDTKAKEVAKNPVVDNPEPSSESSDKSLWKKITSSKATFKFQSPIVIVDTPPAKTPSQNKWSKVLAQHSDSVTYTEEYDAPLSGDHDDLSCV